MLLFFYGTKTSKDKKFYSIFLKIVGFKRAKPFGARRNERNPPKKIKFLFNVTGALPPYPLPPFGKGGRKL